MVEGELCELENKRLVRRRITAAICFETERIGLRLGFLIGGSFIECLSFVCSVESILRVVQRGLVRLDDLGSVFLGHILDAIVSVVAYRIVRTGVRLCLQCVIAWLPRLDSFIGGIDCRLLRSIEGCFVLLLRQLDDFIVGQTVEVAEGQALALVARNVAVPVEG